MTKVIFRKSKNPYTKAWEVEAFFPETYNRGQIEGYAHIGQHFNADIAYYWTTRKATESEYKALYDELTNIVGYELRIMQRMTY